MQKQLEDEIEGEDKDEEKNKDGEDEEQKEEEQAQEPVEDAPMREMGSILKSNMKKIVKSTIKRGGKNRGILAQLQLLDSMNQISEDFFSTESNSMSVPKNYMNFPNPFEQK